MQDSRNVFKFRLALALGKSVQELSASMTEHEFLCWHEFFRIWPNGDDAMDTRFAILTDALYKKLDLLIVTIPNFTGKNRPYPKRFEWQQFLPMLRWGRDRKRSSNMIGKSAEENAAIMRAKFGIGG